MKAKKGKGVGLIVNNKGFTLIEMAIVLIIIGIIIGAVVKGKDLVRSAEQKRLYSKFVSSWELAYNSYYDRTGWILGDVNDPDNGVTAGGRDGHCSTASEANIVSQLQRVGLETPGAGPTGSRLTRTYTGSQGNSYELNIAFDYRAAAGNYIRVYGSAGGNGIPAELGMAWDRIIDEQRDGTAGDLLYTADYTGSPLGFGTWPDATAATVALSAAILRLSF